MAIDYTFEQQDDLLTVKASGKDDNLDQVKEYSMAILGTAISAGCNKVLIDEREFDYSLETIDIFKSAVFISETVPHEARIALVCKPEKIEKVVFWETVAVNRGMKAKVFIDHAAAEQWLLSL